MTDLKEGTIVEETEEVEVKKTDTSSKENEEIETEEVETMIIDEEDIELKEDDGDVLEVKSEPVRSKRDFVKEVKDLSEAEEEKMEKALECDEVITGKEQVKVVDLLTRFKEYVSGDKFDKKCKEAGKKHGLDGKTIKNKFIRNSLKTIADILNLTISITGDIILGAANFINMIICSITKYTTDALHKIINILTLNCGGAL